MKKRIAITGGIGSGKSYIASILKDMGYDVFSCDEIYKKVLLSKEYVEKIAQLFPMVVRNGKIDKNKLGNIVFSDPEKRKLLNGVAHPLIMRELFKEMDNANSPCVFAEVPLLFEENYVNLFDGVIVVLRANKERIAAVELRDDLKKEEIVRRMHTQFDYDNEQSQEYFKSIGAHVIKNDASHENLKGIVGETLKSILNERQS
jgi:dephospho-CoA kinase